LNNKCLFTFRIDVNQAKSRNALIFEFKLYLFYKIIRFLETYALILHLKAWEKPLTETNTALEKYQKIRNYTLLLY